MVAPRFNTLSRRPQFSLQQKKERRSTLIKINAMASSPYKSLDPGALFFRPAQLDDLNTVHRIEVRMQRRSRASRHDSELARRARAWRNVFGVDVFLPREAVDRRCSVLLHHQKTQHGTQQQTESYPEDEAATREKLEFRIRNGEVWLRWGRGGCLGRRTHMRNHRRWWLPSTAPLKGRRRRHLSLTPPLPPPSLHKLNSQLRKRSSWRAAAAAAAMAAETRSSGENKRCLFLPLSLCLSSSGLDHPSSPQPFC